MKREKLHPPYLWRYLVQQAFQRRHPEVPVIVANAVIILDSWLRATDRGLEWGSGRSTTWLATRVAHLVTVEHDPAWYGRVRGELECGDWRRRPGDQMAEPREQAYA